MARKREILQKLKSDREIGKEIVSILKSSSSITYHPLKSNLSVSAVHDQFDQFFKLASIFFRGVVNL